MITTQQPISTQSDGIKWIPMLQGKCPRCNRGKVFVSANPYSLSNMITTKNECDHCHLNFCPEPGFYWGATYVSYGITVAFSVFTFVISTFLFGFLESLNLTYVAVNGVLLFLFSPLFFRFSRMLWLWLFFEKDEHQDLQ